MILVELSNHQVTISSAQGVAPYLSAVNGGGSKLLANKIGCGAWETFTMETGKDESCAFKTSNGYYLTAGSAGKNEMTADAKEPFWFKLKKEKRYCTIEVPG